MIIQIRGAYTEGIYCDVVIDGQIRHAYGFDDLKKIFEDARARGEKVEFRAKKVLDDRIELNKLLEGK